jgi:transcriptional regulator with XRE-family HTH domain
MTSTDDILILRQRIGYILKEERERLELTVYALGKMSETGSNQIAAIEDSGTGYTMDAFLRVLTSLGCSMVIINSNLEASEVIGLDESTR